MDLKHERVQLIRENPLTPLLTIALVLHIYVLNIRRYTIFAGELGWELFHKKEHTAELYEALLTAGEDHGIGDFGTYALNSLRLEKGFRAWGFEVIMLC